MCNQLEKVDTINLTLDDLKGRLDKSYELVYVDYQDTLENSLENVQEAIQNQDICILDEAINQEWLIDSINSSVDYIIKELKTELENEYEFDDNELDDLIENNLDELRYAIEDKDISTPLKDLMRNTREIVFFYDTGTYFEESGFDENMFNDNMTLLKDVLQITDDTYDKDLICMLSQASYGGRLVIYFRSDIDDLMQLEGKKSVKFTNPLIAIIDTYNGSGDHTDLYKHSLTLSLNPKNIFIDKLIKYSYVYKVCGLCESFCDCTKVEFVQNDSPMVVSSSLYAEIDVENEYIKAYKNGGCTAGDMDIQRHKNVYYLNDFPCGSHCPKCGTFWID